MQMQPAPALEKTGHRLFPNRWLYYMPGMIRNTEQRKKNKSGYSAAGEEKIRGTGPAIRHRERRNGDALNGIGIVAKARIVMI